VSDDLLDRGLRSLEPAAARRPRAVSRATSLVVIPAFNEEPALPGVLAELARNAPEHDVLVVDDGSTDGTARVAREHGARVARLPFNLGIGGALRTGFRYAARHGYQRVVQIDADGQHDARTIAVLFEELDRGADFVVGSRFAGAACEYHVGHLRGGAMALLRIVVRILTGRAFTDTSSGLRAFNRRTLEYFARSYPVDYMDSVEALLAASRAGLRIVEVPVQMRERAAGVPSTRHLRLVYHYIRLYVVLLLTMHRRRPTSLE
jgi:glycosyltransferase involved in cell wall biosynthesis